MISFFIAGPLHADNSKAIVANNNTPAPRAAVDENGENMAASSSVLEPGIIIAVDG
jgi:hypothetical protein